MAAFEAIDEALVKLRRESGKKRNTRKAKVRIDMRFALGRRVKELVATFRQRLGPDAADPIVDVAITQAAEMVALSEQLRAQALRGQDISPDQIVRACRASDMAVRRLRLDRHKPPPMQPSLQQYLGQRQDNEVP
jgi:hypothetical protein